MIFSKQTTEKLKQLNILEKTQAMSRQEFIDTYKDSDNITLRTMAQKYSNYNEDGTIGDVKRDLVVNIYEPNGEITNNKRKYNKQVYNVFVIIRQLINKYGRDGSDFYLPIEYISRCANSSERTVKKSINTLLKYKVVNFVGYTRDNSIFAMCIFSLHNIDVLNEWIDYGKVLHDTEYKEETINTILKTNTKINSEPKYELHRQQQVKKSLKAMKECPMLIKKFNESNYDYTDFKQSFLLDGKLRAYSNFTLTKNPEHHIENTMRGTMLQELSTINHNSYDYRYDLPASIYTLSHYLKTNELLINKDDKYFYSIFAKKLKEKYNNPNKVTKIDKDLVKTLCMTTYMHGYSFVNKAQFLSGSTKEMTKEEREEYINRDVNKKINEIIEYFSNKPINTNDLYNIYKTFFTYAYEIMLELCDILRSKVFLYESMLFSIAIKLSRDLGYEVVNVYDCFYMANEFADTFTKYIIKQAYIQTREIYYRYKEMKTREKNKELLEYLESIDKIQIIDNRKYVEIGGYYIDFYKNTIHSKLQL